LAHHVVRVSCLSGEWLHQPPRGHAAAGDVGHRRRPRGPL